MCEILVENGIWEMCGKNENTRLTLALSYYIGIKKRRRLFKKKILKIKDKSY